VTRDEVQDDGPNGSWYWGSKDSPLSPSNVSSGWWELHPNGTKGEVAAWVSAAELNSTEGMASIVGNSRQGLSGSCPAREAEHSAFLSSSTLDALPRSGQHRHACACETPGTPLDIVTCKLFAT
jgi:hypothetical protein